MENSEKIRYIVITAIITAIIVFIFCEDRNSTTDEFSIDEAYFEEIQEELKLQEEKISELESIETNYIEEQLADLEGDLSDIYSMIEDVYEEIVPESERKKNIKTLSDLNQDNNFINISLILSEIISGNQKINPELFLNKQNPYTEEIIENYDDIITYLKMYQLDYNGINPLEALEDD